MERYEPNITYERNGQVSGQLSRKGIGVEIRRAKLWFYH